MAFLLGHLPPQLHVVITSRSDPPLPLARLCGRGASSSTRRADLRFTPEEASALLRECGGWTWLRRGSPRWTPGPRGGR